MPHFSGLPFADITNLIAELPTRESETPKNVQDLATWFLTHSGKRTLLKPFLVWLGTSHASSASNTLARAELNALSNGESLMNKLCAGLDIGLKAFDLGIDFPATALSEAECAATIAYGMEALAGEPDFVLLTSFSEAAPPAPLSSLKELAASGRREIAALLGAFIAARLQNTPIFYAGAAAKQAHSLLETLHPKAGNHALNAAHFFKLHTNESEACLLATSLLRGALCQSQP
jgi:nicotinate-nucleotide--dimethylbenzimidazole phosphoribosyltransferase